MIVAKTIFDAFMWMFVVAANTILALNFYWEMQVQ